MPLIDVGEFMGDDTAEFSFVLRCGDQSAVQNHMTVGQCEGIYLLVLENMKLDVHRWDVIRFAYRLQKTVDRSEDRRIRNFRLRVDEEFNVKVAQLSFGTFAQLVEI